MKSTLLFSSASLAMLLCVLGYVVLRRKPLSELPIKKARNLRSKRQMWLNQARIDMTPTQFWLSTTICGFVIFILVIALSKTPLVALMIGIGSASIPYMFISKRRSAISRELINAWPEALRDISATLSAGHSLSFALHALARVGPESISPHMARFEVLERSIGFVGAIEIVREEMSDATTDRILEVFIVAHERGGKVVREIIDDLIEATTQDIALADTIATESIEMKINSRAVVVIPWVVLMLLTLSGGIFREFYRTTSGAIIIGIGAILSAVGILVLSRLTRTELETRVFNSIKEVVS